MKFFAKLSSQTRSDKSSSRLLLGALVASLLLCANNQLATADALQASLSGSINGGSGSSSSFQGSAEASGGSSSSSGLSNSGLQMQGSLGPISGSLSASSSGSGSGGSSSMPSGSSSISGGSSVSASGSLSSSGSGESSSLMSSSAAASASISTESTPKPEGLLSKMKDILKEGKEIVKSSVENLTGKDEKKVSAEGSVSTGSSGIQASGSASVSSSSSSSSSNSGGGILEKFKEKAKEIKEDLKSMVKSSSDSTSSSNGATGSSSVSASGSISTGSSGSSGSSASGSMSGGIGGVQANANVQIGVKKEAESPMQQMSRLVNKGSDAVRESVQRFEDKTSQFGQSFDENIRKPMANVPGSGQQLSQAQVQAQAQISASHNQKMTDDKSVTAEVIDKVREVSKVPVETVLKPIDKALGYEKDPLIKMYDNSIDALKKPIKIVAKPVESVFSGAFKTSEEAKIESFATSNEQERREALLREERARKEDRSVVGEIADRTVELYEKPFEIILKPVDHALGLDKDGKKNPLLKLIDELYGYSKKPVDVLAKPFENILKKMAYGEHPYQVSVRVSSADRDSNDPKLFTRLADGALNIADRVITKPLEIVFKPLDYALGYDAPGKKNPILDAAHSLKNATKLGVELFTRPLDRIIKEIADIGAIKDEAEREAEYERKRQEASRIVRAMDKLHEVAQTPWELVLRPVGKVLGYSKNGQKEPLLRAWDVIHQVVRTPIQVVTKPVEDAILGEQKRQQKAGFKANVKIGNTNIGAQASIGGGGQGPNSGVKAGASMSIGKKEKKNIFVESIKKVEKFAAKPLDVITSPIRRLILGEDDQIGAAKGPQVNAQANIGGGQAQAQANIKLGSGSGNQPDKIVTTIEQMNNVVLKPLEVITQPIADILSSDDDKPGQKKLDVKVQGQAQAQAQTQNQGPQQINKMSASASAQIKKN